MSRRFIPTVTALDAIGDREEFGKLSLRQQEFVCKRLDWVLRINDAGKGGRGKMIKRAAKHLGVSVPTVSRFLRAHREGGWKGLLDNRGRAGKGVPPKFRGYVGQLHLQFQRNGGGREIHRMLVERWELWRKTGDRKFAIPGYDKPPAAGPCGYPDGWSDDSILRMRPDGYSLASVRQGGKRAEKFLPSILKTRVGTRFGQVVFFDDQDYDVKIAPRGTSLRTLRPQGFACLDYLSGAFLDHVVRLRWWDQAGDQYRTLTQQDFTWFVVSFLLKFGYRRDAAGTTFVFEHGTATGYRNEKLSTFGGFSDFDDALAAVSLGCVRVERSGRFNHPAFGGMMFRPQSSGNPNIKAPLESMFNLVRNRMACLPGATGRNRDEKPAEQYGLDLYTGQLLSLWQRLDERHRDLIRFPGMTAEEFGDVTREVYRAINARRDHSLEGWEQLGFVAPQFRFTADERSPWLSREEAVAMPEAARVALMANAATPGHVRTIRLSPAEVATQCGGELMTLPESMVPILVPMQWARPVTVRDDREIWIKDQMLGPESFRYICRIEDKEGARVLKPGTKVLAYLNPFHPERLVICREDGTFIGGLNQKTRAPFMDHEAILDQLKARAEMKADLDTGVRPHLEPTIRERAEMKRVNDRLAKGLQVTPEEIEAARSEAGRKGARTAAANRLQGRGESVDWDTVPDPRDENGPVDPFAELPE